MKDMEESNNPVLMLLGMPRSGTTWIAKIVDSHPDIAYFHEPDSVYPLKDIPLLCTEYGDSQRQQISQLLNGFPYVHEKCLGKRPWFSKSYLTFLNSTLLKYSILASKALAKNLVHYPSKVLRKHRVFTCFKSIESVGRLNVFLDSNPTLKIGLIIRSPFGQINSVLKGSKSQQFDHNDMLSLSNKELENLYHKFGKYLKPTLEEVFNFTPIQQLAYRWLIFNEKALTDAKRYPDRVHIINYEKFCDKPEESTRDLFQFFGLENNPQTKNFLDRSTQNQDDSYYSVNKNSNQAKNAWRKNFTHDEVEQILRVIRDSESEKLFDFESETIQPALS